jgi:hypothetical protein
MPKASQRQFLVRVSDIPDYFMTKSGGNITSSANKVYDGGRIDPDVISSPAEAADVTVSRAYDPFRDGPLLADLRRRVGRFRATVSVTPTDEDLSAIGTPVVYSSALLIAVNEPDFNAASGDAATFELTFSIGAWK